ncbi:MAG: hypothetical protein NUV59_02850 [Patescibacteria group bacterium]|nr:hypothetical protein [Patescibacteria group bacterium]
MERKRAQTGVGYFVHGSAPRRISAVRTRGASPMVVSAVIAVVVLATVIGWRAISGGGAGAPEVAATQGAQGAPQGAPAQGSGDLFAPYALGGDGLSGSATSSDPISQLSAQIIGNILGAYTGLQQMGTYSTSTANAAADNILPLLRTSVPYKVYTRSDIQVDTDNSYARMLAYRSDLRDSLAPLLENTVPEYETFAQYVDTKDASYLTELRKGAQRYFDAASSTAKVVAPADAAPHHLMILNAMQQFGATLEALAGHADDPFAVAALLGSYERAESGMLTSFNSLTTYYKSKNP